jgi:hypothetical protein
MKIADAIPISDNRIHGMLRAYASSSDALFLYGWTLGSCHENFPRSYICSFYTPILAEADVPLFCFLALLPHYSKSPS